MLSRLILCYRKLTRVNQVDPSEFRQLEEGLRNSKVLATRSRFEQLGVEDISLIKIIVDVADKIWFWTIKGGSSRLKDHVIRNIWKVI